MNKIPSKFIYSYREISGKRRRIQYTRGSLPMITTLPGLDERQKPSCGLIDKKRRCVDSHKGKLEDHVHKIFKYSCDKVICEVCWTGRIKDLSKDIYDRMKQIFKTAGKEITHTRLRHFSITPPDPNTENPKEKHLIPLGKQISQMASTSDGLDKLYNIIKRIMDEQGFIGGNIVYHPFRIKDQDLYHSNQLLPASKRRDLWRDPEVEKEFYPHFHILGSGFIRDPAGTFKNKYGWQYHNHSFEDGSSDGDRHVSTIRYELGHAGVCTPEGKTKIKDLSRWFGLFSRYRLEIEKIESEEPHHCDCGSEVHDYLPSTMEICGDGSEEPLPQRTVRYVDGKYEFLNYAEHRWEEIECWRDEGQHIKKIKEKIWTIKLSTYVIINRCLPDLIWNSYSESEQRLWTLSWDDKGRTWGRKKIMYGHYEIHERRSKKKGSKEKIPKGFILYRGIWMRPSKKVST